MTESAVLPMRKRGGPCRIIAHRGFSAAHRENTVEAYERALRAGADLVELDLRHSSDGTLVCQHDAMIGADTVANLSAAELAARGVAILADVLPALVGRIGLVLDLKLPDVGLAADTLSLLRRFSVEPQAVIGVRSLDQARFVRADSPGSVILGFLKDHTVFSEFYRAGGDIARLWEDDCNPDLLDTVRCGDHPVWVTAGRRPEKDRPGDIDLPRLRRLIACGVDGILVNDPVLGLQARNGGTS